MHHRSLRRFLLAVLAVVSVLTARADWTAVASPTTEALWGLCYGADQFVATGTAGTVLTSPNGATWTARTSGTTEWLTAIAYAADQHLYVAVGEHGTILTSPDALVWTARTSGATQRLNNVAYAAGRWLAVGEAGTVATSTDAIAWTVTTLPLDTWLRGLCYGPDSFLIGAGDGTLCSTNDGVHFRYLSHVAPGVPNTHSVEVLFYTSGVTFAAGSYGEVVCAEDRINWVSKSETTDTGSFRGLAKSDLAVIAVGESGAVFGTTYDTTYLLTPSRTTLGTQNLNAVAVGANSTVIVGDQGTIYTSLLAAPTPPTVASASFTPSTPYVGSTVVLSPVFSGPPPFTFQWSRAGQPLTGATAENLVLPNYTRAAAGTYTLTVTNSAGSASIDLAVPEPLDPPSTTVDRSFIATLIAANLPSIIPLASGQFLVGLDRITRFDADGTWDRAFHAAGSGNVSLSPEVTLLSEGKLLVQSRYGDSPSVVRLDSDGSPDSTFTPLVTTDRVSPLADGRFVHIAISNNVATVSRLNADGSSDSSFAPFAVPLTSPYGGFTYWSYGAPITALDEQGRVYVAALGPVFRLSNGACYIFRLTPTGELDASFTPVAYPHSIASLKIIHGKLCYDTGSNHYAAIPAYAAHTFGRLNEDGTVDSTFSPLTFSAIFDASHAKVFLAVGTFDAAGGLIATTSGSSAQGLIRYDANGVLDPSFSARLDASVSAISRLTLAADGSLLAIGTFTSLNGHPTAGLARIIPTTDAYATYLSNLSIRTTAGTGDDTFIAGFVVTGDASASRGVLVRALGPALVPLGIRAAEALPDPALTLHQGSATLAANDDWDSALDTRATALGASPLTPGSRDAALLTSLAPGAYTAHVTRSSASASPNATGIALVELYDADPAPTSATAARLVNLSGRARVGTGDNVLIAGFVVSGHSTKRVLVRAIGPDLLLRGVTDALLDPQLALYSGSTLIGANDDWASANADVFSTVGASALTTGSKDAALVLDLPPGVYSAVVSGANGTSGVALVELYEVP